MPRSRGLRLHRQTGEYGPVAFIAAGVAVPLNQTDPMTTGELIAKKESRPTEQPPAPPAGEAVNILLVDDEPRNLAVLESILESPGLQLFRAQTAEQTLMALIERDFAAIVLDVQMPGMSGFELAKLIKLRKRNRHIPIIFITAFYHENKDVLSGYDVGAVDYLTKPVDPHVLTSKI